VRIGVKIEGWNVGGERRQCGGSLFFLFLSFCRLVKDTSKWNNANEGVAAEQATCEQITASLTELDEGNLNRLVEEATAKRDAAAADLDK
jgi:hypothetical protein